MLVYVQDSLLETARYSLLDSKTGLVRSAKTGWGPATGLGSLRPTGSRSTNWEPPGRLGAAQTDWDPLRPIVAP